MKVLFINGRQSPPFFQGGDGVSIHTLLRCLCHRGYSIMCIGKINPHQRVDCAATMIADLQRQGLTLTQISEEQVQYRLDEHYQAHLVTDGLFQRELATLIMDAEPDILLTQLEDSHTVIRLAHQLEIPVVHFVHDTHVLNRQSLEQSQHIAHVFFNSCFTAALYQPALQAPSSVLYPAIEWQDYLVCNRTPRWITMINPVARKGARILESLIRTFVHESFLLVPGWEPVEIDVAAYPNVTLADRVQPAEMRAVYAQTKLLLVPSQYEETFGRVAVEAIVAGVPVIASHVGGLPEAVGPGGWYVQDFRQEAAWKISIEAVLANPAAQQHHVIRGQAYSLRFTSAQGAEHCDRILRGIIAKRKESASR